MTAQVGPHPPSGHLSPQAGEGPSRESGFTLLEILLALVLFAFVMAGVWGALASATRITHASDALLAQGEAVATTQRFVRTWLAAAQAQPYLESGAKRARMFAGAATRLQYVAPLPSQAGHAGLYLQTLELVRRKSGRYALELAYAPYANGQPSAAGAHEVLLSNLRGGSFQYLAATGFNQPAAWRSDWQAVNGLPLAVRIHLDPAWRARVAFPDLVVRLQMGTGFGAQAPAVPR